MMFRLCRFVLLSCCTANIVYADFSGCASATNTDNATDPNNPSDAEMYLLALSSYRGGATSPDCKVSYFLDPQGGDVYAFAQPAALRTGIAHPIDIAILSDGLTGLVTAGGEMAGLYVFPTGGVNHTATQIFPKSLVIEHPQCFAIGGDMVYVGDNQSDTVYAVLVDSPSYSATAVQHLRADDLVVSSDGYLYIASNKSVYRVPLSSPTDVPILVSEGSFKGDIAGLAVSPNGDRVAFTTIDKEDRSIERYVFSTGQGFPQTPVLLDLVELSRRAERNALFD